MNDHITAAFSGNSRKRCNLFGLARNLIMSEVCLAVVSVVGEQLQGVLVPVIST